MQRPLQLSLAISVILQSLSWTSILFSQDEDQRPWSKKPTPADVRIAAWQRHQKLKESSPHQDLKWELLGPRMCGGRIESIACPDDHPSTMYVGVGSGGLWKTINHGLTWKPIFDEQPIQAIGDVCVSRSHSNVIWVGTGEVLMARSSLAGLGVFKSEDGGESWQAMGLEDTHHIGRVVIDPDNPEVVYVAAIGHRYSGNKNRGVFKTSDGGKSWTHSLYLGDDVSAIDLAIDPQNAQILYATLWQRDLDGQDHYGPKSGIYKTTDGGKSWKRLAGGLPGKPGSAGRIAVAVAPCESNRIYALYDNAVFDDEEPRDLLFMSSDSGETWKIVNDSKLKTGWDWCEIRVSPDNPDQVYSIGQKSYRSSDGGRSFEEIGGTIIHLLEHGSNQLHLDTHAMWINPRNPDHVVFGNDGGLYISFDRCETWMHANNLPIAECYAVTYDSAEPYNIYIGTQDNAALFGSSGQRPRDGLQDDWQHVYLDRWGGGDSYFTYRDPADPDSIYYEHQYGDLRRKNMKSGKTIGIRPRPEMKSPIRNAWMTPYFVSAYDSKSLYYASNHVFKSADRGMTWEMISPDLTAGPRTINLRYQAITAMVESPLKPGLLFAGTDNGNLWMSKTDGTDWNAIDSALPRCNFRRVVASMHHPERLYVALSGLQTDDFSAYVYRSDDLGKTWKSIAKGLPDARVNLVVEDPRQENIVYVGNDMGVYVSQDGGNNWESLSNGLPAVSVHDGFVHPKTNELVIGTHGRSVFLMDVSSITPK